MVRSNFRPRRLAVAFALLIPLLVTACEPAATIPPDLGAQGAGRVVAGSLHGRTGGFLIVRDAASRVDVRLADLPGLLYRISTPAGSGLAPRVTGGDGRVRVRLSPTGDDGPDTVTILLNRAVLWDIRLPAGAGEQRLYLGRGSVARLDLGSSGLLDVELPQPEGTVPVTLRGGAGTVSVVAPRDAPVRFRLLGGAGSVDTPWVASNGALVGAVLADPRWPAVADRYAVYARAGVGSLTLR
ncbi:MAG TPA: hypothetical protein VFR35_14330 [Actinoplanes sp.]|nr:hypothetical protein [Actinoplanes sp.]